MAFPFRLVVALLILTAWSMRSAVAARVDIAIDVDSAWYRTVGYQPPLKTQSGFRSWELSEQYSDGASLTEQGVTFTMQPYHYGGYAGSLGSRVRESEWGGGGGGELDDLLVDFAWVDGSSISPRFPSDAIILGIDGLPPSTYRMTSWHFDGAYTQYAHCIQIEVGDSLEAATREIVVESFPLGTAPATYTFDVTEPGQSKVVYYRVTGPTSTGMPPYRARLNGFTLVSGVRSADFQLPTSLLPSSTPR